MFTPRRRRANRLLLAGVLVLLLAVSGAAGFWAGMSSDDERTKTETDTEGRPVSEPQRIMLAGDSMTQGADGDRTWRYHLWNHLEPHVEGLDFVGPYTEPATPEMILPVPTTEAEDPESPGEDPAEEQLEEERDDPGNVEYHDTHFDQDHNALWGRTLRDAAATIQEDVATHRPDVLCVMLGINDLLWPVSEEEMEELLRGYIDSARASNPNIRLVLAEALPIALNESDEGFALRTYVYNEVVRSVAAKMSTEASPVISLNVAVQEDWDVETDTYDGTHPNSDGELKIAAAFADALSNGYGIGPAHPRPLPIVP